MSKNTTAAVVVEFTADKDVTMSLRPAAVSRDDLRQIGLAYLEANDKGKDAMLEAHGGLIVRRALKTLANLANRLGDKAVAEYANTERDQIVLERKTA